MIARGFVANSAIRAHLLRSTRRPLRLPLSLSSRSYSESDPSRSTQGSQSSKHEEGDWKSEVRTNWLGWAKTIVGAGLALGGYVTRDLWLPDWYREHQRHLHESERDSAIYETLKKGPTFSDVLDNPIAREAIVDEVRKIIAPTEQSRGYSLVIGEHGTGKTSLIHLAVNSLEEPKGIAYVDIPNDIDKDSAQDVVTDAMRNALGWTLDPVIESKRPLSLYEVLKVFSRVALKYRQAHKNIPVLVVDNSNRLPESFLRQFQDYAKEAADNKITTIVFVTSEGRIPRRMRERSSWSRNESVLEVGDVSKDEAFQYLKLRNIDGEQAAQVYELVGGRIILLKHIANKILKGTKIDDLRQALLNEAESQLTIAEMLPKGKFYDRGKAIISRLLREGAISNRTYWDIVGNREIGEEMLQKNVFSHHFYANVISFQSTPMQQYCEQHPELWKVR